VKGAADWHRPDDPRMFQTNWKSFVGDCLSMMRECLEEALRDPAARRPALIEAADAGRAVLARIRLEPSAEAQIALTSLRLLGCVEEEILSDAGVDRLTTDKNFSTVISLRLESVLAARACLENA